MELLSVLKAKGIKWGIHTNKTHAIVAKIAWVLFFKGEQYEFY